MPNIVQSAGSWRVDVTGASIIAGAVVVYSTPAVLMTVLVTVANGTNAINITDGVGGPIIGIVPASATAGTVIQLGMYAKTSINIPQTALAGSLAISVAA